MTENENVEEFLLRLSDPAEDVRANAARALAQTSRPEAVLYLVRALNDSSPGVRINAASALGLLKAAVAAPAIGMLMADTLRSVRKASAEALAEIGESGFSILASGAKSENPVVRQTAAFGLAYCIGSQTVDILIAALRDSDENVRYYAADSLSILHPERALESLIETLQRPAESEEVLSSVADAIVSIGGESARRLLLNCVGHSNEAAQRWAGAALEDLDGSR